MSTGVYIALTTAVQSTALLSSTISASVSPSPPPSKSATQDVGTIKGGTVVGITMFFPSTTVLTFLILQYKRTPKLAFSDNATDNQSIISAAQQLAELGGRLCRS